MTDRWSRWAAGLVEGGWLACAVGVPLFFSPVLSLTFTADKVLLFRLLSEIVALVALLGWLQRPTLRPTSVSLALGAYALVLGLAAFLGRNPAQSFWGSYLRLFGLFTLLHGGALFLAVVGYFQNERQWRRLLGAVSAVAVRSEERRV